MARAELTYADSSALVKLLIDEPESVALEREIAKGSVLTTSRIAIVEVSRATALSDPSPEKAEDTRRLLSSCLLVQVTDEVLEGALTLVSEHVRTLDAIHLATALRMNAQRMLTYDRRMLASAVEHGIAVSHPGLREPQRPA